MIKSEPKSILQFLANHYELLRELFDLQVKNEIIRREQLYNSIKEYGSDLEVQLKEHKIIVEQNDDYVINEPYFILLLINLLYFLYFQFYKFFMKD